MISTASAKHSSENKFVWNYPLQLSDCCNQTLKIWMSNKQEAESKVEFHHWLSSFWEQNWDLSN